ncbi:MAG: hypothetical protein D6711_19225 [Chloroflexi bacterium]|nr:MAG: hypothetical protein D6711_19225 [Chloroflexota bacterium]
MKRYTIILLITCFFSAFTYAQNEEHSIGSCNALQNLIANEQIPYDLGIGGGVIPPNIQQSVTLAGYADVWTFNFMRERSTAGAPIETPITISFTSGQGLEMALFAGMEQPADVNGISGYRPLSTTEPFTYLVNRDGFFSLVVRRQNLIDPQPIDYSFTASFISGGNVVLSALRDETTSRPQDNPPELQGGVSVITINQTLVYTHPGSAISIGSHNGERSQVFLGANANLLVNNWANRLMLIGGDLVATGSGRTFYLQDYGYNFTPPLDGDLINITDSNGTRWRLDWNSISGVWIMQDCAGFRLNDGRIFVGTFNDSPRVIQFQGALESFTIALNNQRLNLDWAEIDSIITLNDETFTLNFDDDRQLVLNSSDVTFESSLAILLADRNATLSLDWLNLKHVAWLEDAITLEFSDEFRTTTTRSAESLTQFEALQDVIHMVYATGEERLLLPATESYVEIITPATQPVYDARLLPGDEGYFPRGQNNTGGECYPINTIQTVGNCPANGDINPANGNLWYGITDLIAYGGELDLLLTRSYNSRWAAVDSPFGFGWTMPYLLDYNVAYNPVTNSRPITPEVIQSYPVSLDVTYAPYGIVTYITASGSRHQFISQQDRFTAGEMTSPTMPGWVLSRQSVRDNWTLTLPDGLTYIFDRAGRIQSYGYGSRRVVVNYPSIKLNGAGESTEPVIITDAADSRQLELYFNAEHRIARAVLRDTTAETCDPNTCFEVQYDYDTNGNLIEVIYPDGERALYVYDTDHRLLSHDDPRAPISQNMTYVYDEDGTITVQVDGEFTWRSIAPPVDQQAERRVSVTDVWSNTRTYTYTYIASDVKSTENAFTLINQTSPLNGVSDFESVPVTYDWSNGLLDRVRARSLRENIGRNSVVFSYQGAGYISRIRGGYPEFSVGYNTNNQPETLTFGDDSTEQFTYDQNGRIATFIDRNGAEHTYTWNNDNQVIRINDTTYAYNDLGLVSQVGDVTFTYDRFGRLTGINDPLTGEYIVTYAPNEISVTDVTGTITTSRFDASGNLIERVISASDGTAYRHTRYEYDSLHRLTAEIKLLDDVEYITRYTYTQTLQLPILPDDPAPTQIRGYTISITDPYGRTEQYTYDAQDRLRQVINNLGYITRYDYVPVAINGLQITERLVINNQTVQQTTYRFNLEWQLIGVQRGDVVWELTPYFETSRPQYLEAPRAGIASMEWSNYSNGRATSVSINQTMPQLASGADSPDYRLTSNYDAQGRPLNNGRVAYCPQEDGTERAYYSDRPITCDEFIGYYPAITWDDAGRVTQVSTTDGSRDYIYTPLQDAWQVDVLFSSGESWTLTYNGIGELVAWVDENGFTTTYTYDMLGRLTRVESPVPDASFRYEYNAANLLTLVQDDLGRGERYDYDALGRLTVRQNIRNANATIYGYDAAGRLTSVISPLGNTTTFLYDDIGRLTSVIEPTGSTYTFNWQETNNRLEVRDPRGNVTRYSYDGLGSLWRIDDAQNRVHEIHYNADGNVIGWWQANGAREINLTQIEEGFLITDGAWSQVWDIDSRVRQIGNLTLQYDLLGRLSQIGQDVIRYDEASVTIGDNPPIHFDPLYRQVDDYIYQSVRGADLQIVGTDAILTYSDGDEAARPPSITLNERGRMTVYTFTPDGLLSEINHQACMDTNQLMDDPFNLSTCQREAPEQIWRTTHRIVYDPLGRPLRYIDPEQNIHTYGYDDAGNLVVYQDLDGKTFDYIYDELNRLQSITAPTGIRLLLRYDALDRVNAVCLSRAEISTTYAECESNGTVVSTYNYDSAFDSPTPPDTPAETATLQGFIYDERGLLTEIEGVMAIDYLTTPEGRVLVIEIERADGELIQIQVNRRGQTKNITYFNSNLLNDFVFDASGTIQRQSIIGNTAYFEANAGSYIIVTGYDNDNRPVTMRVTDRTSGTLLYLLTFTYNNLGQRINETRQYANGTQITITYTYNDQRQLIERRVLNNRSDTTGLPGIWLMFGITWLLPRRRRWIMALAAGAIIMLGLSFSLAQPFGNPLIYTYDYDNHGNLTTIRADDTVCWVYGYDEQNRLISITDSTGRTIRQYSYDQHNRLIRAGDDVLSYANDRLIRVTNDNESRAYGIPIDGLPAFYQQSEDSILWLINDGQDQLLTTNLDNGLWVFDPLGRYLSLTPKSTDDPCVMNTMPADMNALAPLESLGMIWDGYLYFDDGRAYLPEIGLYLQRDPHGPDVYGAIYAYPSRTITPPVRTRLPAYVEGLFRLRDALKTLDIYPTPPAIRYDGGFQLDHALSLRSQYTQLADLLDFPAWLMMNYNLPSAMTDHSGALRMMPDNTPQGWNMPIIPTASALFSDPWLPTISPPLERLNNLITLTHPRTDALRTYEPFAWVTPLPTLSTSVDYPDVHHSPSSIMSHLPGATHQPEAAADVLETILTLQTLPTLTEADWQARILEAVRPATPSTPVQSVEDWLKQWFSENTLGIK